MEARQKKDDHFAAEQAAQAILVVFFYCKVVLALIPFNIPA